MKDAINIANGATRLPSVGTEASQLYFGISDGTKSPYKDEIVGNMKNVASLKESFAPSHPFIVSLISSIFSVT
jgi:hypothetical protein